MSVRIWFRGGWGPLVPIQNHKVLPYNLYGTRQVSSPPPRIAWHPWCFPSPTLSFPIPHLFTNSFPIPHLGPGPYSVGARLLAGDSRNRRPRHVWLIWFRDVDQLQRSFCGLRILPELSGVSPVVTTYYTSPNFTYPSPSRNWTPRA